MVSGLADDTKSRLRGTRLADHQAGLKLLSEQPADMQTKICDLLFSTPPQAANVADAILLAEGRRPPSARDKLFRATADNLQRVGATGRATLFATYEDEIRDFARARGWL